MATVYFSIDVASARLKGSSIPELVNIAGTNAPLGGYALDAAVREDLFFQTPIPLFGVSNTQLIVRLYWYSRTGQTSGNAVFGARVAAMSGGDAVSMEAKSFAASTSAAAVAVNGTAKGPTFSSVSIANLDSLATAAPWDFVELNVFRDGADGTDTLTGDAIITAIYLEYSDS